MRTAQQLGKEHGVVLGKLRDASSRHGRLQKRQPQVLRNRLPQRWLRLYAPASQLPRVQHCVGLCIICRSPRGRAPQSHTDIFDTEQFTARTFVVAMLTLTAAVEASE